MRITLSTTTLCWFIIASALMCCVSARHPFNPYGIKKDKCITQYRSLPDFHEQVTELYNGCTKPIKVRATWWNATTLIGTHLVEISPNTVGSILPNQHTQYNTLNGVWARAYSNAPQSPMQCAAVIGCQPRGGINQNNQRKRQVEESYAWDLQCIVNRCNATLDVTLLSGQNNQVFMYNTITVPRFVGGPVLPVGLPSNYVPLPPQQGQSSYAHIGHVEARDLQGNGLLSLAHCVIVTVAGGNNVVVINVCDCAVRAQVWYAVTTGRGVSYAVVVLPPFSPTKLDANVVVMKSLNSVYEVYGVGIVVSSDPNAKCVASNRYKCIQSDDDDFSDYPIELDGRIANGCDAEISIQSVCIVSGRPVATMHKVPAWTGTATDNANFVSLGDDATCFAGVIMETSGPSNPGGFRRIAHQTSMANLDDRGKFLMNLVPGFTKVQVRNKDPIMLRPWNGLPADAIPNNFVFTEGIRPSDIGAVVTNSTNMSELMAYDCLTAMPIAPHRNDKRHKRSVLDSDDEFVINNICDRTVKFQLIDEYDRNVEVITLPAWDGSVGVGVQPKSLVKISNHGDHNIGAVVFV